MLFFPLINVKMQTIVAILTFMSKPGRVAQSVGHLTRKSGVLGKSGVLAQEGQLSVTGESMSTKYWLTA